MAGSPVLAMDRAVRNTSWEYRILLGVNAIRDIAARGVSFQRVMAHCATGPGFALWMRRQVCQRVHAPSVLVVSDARYVFAHWVLAQDTVVAA